MNKSNLGLDKLFSRSGIYFLSGVGQQAVGFLLLPLYTNVLSPADYGTLEILNTTGLILLMILNLGLPSAVMKCFHRDCRSDADRQAVFTTSLAIGLPALAVGCALLFWRADWLTSALLGEGGSRTLVRLMLVWVFLNGMSGILQALFRAREEAMLLGSLTLGTFTLMMFLNIYFVWSRGLGVEGVLLGNCLSTGAAVIGALLLLKGRASSRVEWALVRPLVSFGVLIVPAALSGWMLNVADRYFLRHFGQMSSVGIYSLGYKLGMVLDVVIVAPFQLAWPPFSFAISTQENHRHVYARTLTYLTLVSSVAVLGITILTPVVLHYATHPDYLNAYAVVPLISLAYAFNGIYYCVSPGIHLRQHTRWLPLIVVAAAAVNVGLCFALIPTLGMMGAAWATTISFAVLAATTFAVAQAVYPVAYEDPRLATVVAGAVLVYFVCVSLPIASPLVKGAAGLGTLACGYPVFLLMTGFLSADEQATLGRWLRQLTNTNPLSAVGSTLDEPSAPIPDINVRSDANA